MAYSVGTIGVRPSTSGPLWRKLQADVVNRTRAEMIAEIERLEADKALAQETIKRTRVERENLMRRRGKTLAIEIRARVAEKHDLTVHDLQSAAKNARVAWPRHEAWFQTATDTLISYPEIGRLYGSRDHSTIVKGIRAHHRRSGMKEAGVPLPRGMTPR